MNKQPETAPPEWFTSLPNKEQQAYITALSTFAHDLRQSMAQIYSAEELIRRGLAAGKGESELKELLDVIREANRNASMSMDSFVGAILDGIDPSHTSTN